jgi:hypothetical protein
MKASDIKKLIAWGDYSVDIRLGSLERQIREWQDEGLELCPDFQRGHVWTQSQQIKFIEYILRSGKTSPLLFNHKNWFDAEAASVVKPKPMDFVCVDGLQRLTALLLFLNDELPIFDGHTRSQIEGIDVLNRIITVTARINTLATDREILQWYLELNAGGTPHTEAELERVRNLLAATK